MLYGRFTLKTRGNFKNVFLCGDINIDISPNSTDKYSNDYLNLLAGNGILPGHTEITHVRTCLDHIMLKTKLEAECVVLETSVTDHQSVALSVNLGIELIPKNKQVSHIDYEKLDILVQNIDFGAVLRCSDPNSAANLLVERLSSAITVSLSIKKTPKRQLTHRPWITRALLRCMRNRDNLFKKFKCDPSNEVIKITYK